MANNSEGVVAAWMPERSFGFIRADDNSILRDVYFHATRVLDGRDRMKKGVRVEFDLLVKPDGRYAAMNVKVKDTRGEKSWQTY
jgi:cold shock CspA family protein